MYKLWGDNMKIENIVVQNNGYVDCKSCFYSVCDVLQDGSYSFFNGINKLTGEIDSGIWALSYTLSMYKHRPKDFTLFNKPEVIVDKKTVTLSELSEYSCYMDRIYPLFSNGDSVKKQIERGLKHNKSNFSVDDVKGLFYLHEERIKRPLTGVGNEIFRAMAAIAFSYGKEIFCFPWLSDMRFKGYHENLSGLLPILEGLKKMVVMPVGMPTSED